MRVSGPGAKTLLARIFLPHSRKLATFRPWTLHRGILLDCDDQPLDDVLAVFMPGPKTYSGEDMAEIHCHGSAVMANAVLDSLLRLGVRLAEKGEFTRRAFLNGRLDLAQAEAVAELTLAKTREGLAFGLARLEGRLSAQIGELAVKLDELRALARVGVDFPDDEIDSLAPAEFATKAWLILDVIQQLLKGASRAALMADGGLIAIAGPVNAGKSSLLNALAGENRALVTDLPGTTRDFIEVSLNLDGIPVRLADTAGLRANPADKVEELGIARANELIDRADLILLLLDAASPDPFVNMALTQIKPQKTLLIWNKTDLAQPPDKLPPCLESLRSLNISAKTGQNLDALCQLASASLLGQTDAAEASAVAPNARQAAALRAAARELQELLADIDGGLTYDCCLARLDTAAQTLAEVVTLAADNELLDRIFARFCIGK